MHLSLKYLLSICTLLAVGCTSLKLSDGETKLSVDSKNVITFSSEGVSSEYVPEFVVIYKQNDPRMKMIPANLPDVLYNAVSWLSDNGDAKRVDRTADQTGDGFDDKILDATVDSRTFNLFNVGENISVKPLSSTQNGETISFSYPENDKFKLEATLSIDTANNYPMLSFTLTPKVEGYFSVGYDGYRAYDMEQVEQIWQPMIWQEKRFPDRAYMTLAFRCPVPSTFVMHEGVSRGVVADPSEFPFDPLPTLTNSRFGVALRTADSLAKPMLFAPAIGGVDSYMTPEASYSFKALLFADKGNTAKALQTVAERIYGFTDYRHNAIGTLNKTIENIIDYTLSDYSWFIDKQKGCAYSTDVPDAVKNVSSLNPLEVALINDNEQMYTKRAYPILEYILSREKFLFTADSTQKIQFPSRRLNGPCSSISELTTAYNVFGQRNPFMVSMAKKEFKGVRVRNLDVVEIGETWKNSMHIYKATGDKTYLDAAIKGADAYIANRIDNPATDFTDPDAGGFFFWTGFAPKWIDLLELYEITKNDKYLNAAHLGARLYTQYIWFGPAIPDTEIVVNEDGKAPHYDYLKQKGHEQMVAAKESVPAWRLSEIGLTPESSGTCSGHRGIFMANYAAWFVRLAYYTGDDFLARVAKSAIVGRYSNFPGYHINTARTTIYEKEDYPLRTHKKLGVNSFHYNHIMPHISLLYDYMITDIMYRSKGEVQFPDEFIEAYAYLQSKFYGHKSGTVYGEKAWLWMPSGLVNSSDVELNYISARGENALYLSFSNQVHKQTVSTIALDCARLGIDPNADYKVSVMGGQGSATNVKAGSFTVDVAANGITTVKIEMPTPKTTIQQRIQSGASAWSNDYAVSKDDMVQTMILNLGDGLCNVYTYLKIEDIEYKSASVVVNGVKMTDAEYPYEFTIKADSDVIEIKVSALAKNGQVKTWEPLYLKK